MDRFFKKFVDRHEAGTRLATILTDYKRKKKSDDNFTVIALPRGGVVVGYEVAKALKLPLDIVCPRKICAPGNPEFAVGAVTETGVALAEKRFMRQLGISPEYLHQTIAEEKIEAQRRLRLYRRKRTPRDFKGKNILLVDDGLATGSTMKAAIGMCYIEGANEVVVAVPVGPQETIMELRLLCHKVICFYTPIYFQAVGEFYDSFAPTSDEEVIALLRAL